MCVSSPDLETRLARARFRAWHRGTREADYTFGGYFDRYSLNWDEAGLAWFEALLAEDDVDVLAWVFGTADVPPRFQGPAMEAMQRLDFVQIKR